MAMASDAQRAGLVDATRSVVADLRQDPTTASAIDTIAELARETPAGDPVRASCGGHGDEAALNGSYAFTSRPRRPEGRRPATRR